MTQNTEQATGKEVLERTLRRAATGGITKATATERMRAALALAVLLDEEMGLQELSRFTLMQDAICGGRTTS